MLYNEVNEVTSMKLSSKTITAIKMFIDLGEHYEQGFVSLLDISKRKDLSKKFLEQIVPLYKNSGLIIGGRGNQGGYKLSKNPNDISLKDIIYISENNLFSNDNQDNVIDNVIKGADSLLNDYFSSITLSKMIEMEVESYANNYCI